MNEGSYKYNGAKALVALQEIHIKEFYNTWKKAKELDIKLPITDDPFYKSLNTLLYHVLRSSRGYIVWICSQLKLPDPKIDEAPLPEIIIENAEKFIEHLVERWKLPLRNVEPELFEDKVYKSNWDVDFCIESMLEHAVMHPIRHKYQLDNLIRQQTK
ncbi:MAG: hypothetical protein PHY57_07755 [Ignavibacterium sp.]|jgi:hypothetical protein|nr:MAG: hypothetical protein F9K42_11890 [Ignavibacterium sp.]MBL1153838.1 hypothetical protein [Ignavibacteriota bacterium]MCO6446523.1 hypothetical protein [Ignavibacterium album]MDX9711093.1 hypothetical protein [Ignavibacteriaceae bacterium]MBW7842344.1 hypothetical protein [Ignavibacterium sp.]